MRPADIPKTAIITPFGLFKFFHLPFGLPNAAQTFQRMMDKIFGDLHFCFVYLDDISVFSNSVADHQLHLRLVLDLCHLNGLTINLEKCVFTASQVEYLGHFVSSSESSPLNKHIHAISVFPPLTNHPALQRFLGMVNFYRKFIPGAALILRPLTDALHGDPMDFSWPPRWTLPLSLHSGAYSGAS